MKTQQHPDGRITICNTASTVTSAKQRFSLGEREINGRGGGERGGRKKRRETESL